MINSKEKQTRINMAMQVSALSEKLISDGLLKPAELINTLEAISVNNSTGNKIAFKAVESNCMNAASSLSKPAVLVYCSARRPGGGYLNGARAQEEDISISSSWATQARLASPGFYNQNNPLGPDSVLLANGCWIDNQNKRTDVIFVGVSAPNLNRSEASEIPLQNRIDALAARLTTGIINANKAGATSIVLGAIGCGVFKWDLKDSAMATKIAVNHAKSVGVNMDVVVAIPDKHSLEVFTKHLSNDSKPSLISRRP